MGDEGHCEPLRPRFKLWLSRTGGEGVFGDGKWRLLAAIDAKGSLQAASEHLGMSYRKAWGDLRKAERGLGVRFLERHRGGSGGGGTTLTQAGRNWLEAYSRFRREIELAMTKAYDSHIGGLLGRGKANE